jgi:hypothetical protein
MNKRLYLDGCSYTYGLGLDSADTLAGRWSSEYEVINKTRTGKSNLAIALDTFENIQNCDLVVIGWTYSSRSYLKYQNYDIDLLPTRPIVELPFKRDTKVMSDIYTDLHRNFYALHDTAFAGQHSDFLISSIKCMCEKYQKKSVFFSWERRKIDFDMYYPTLHPKMLLPDGHLNVNGTTHLYNNLQQLIYEQG